MIDITNEAAIAVLESHEAFRLASLHQYGLLGTAQEPGYDQIVALAANLFAAPISLVSLVGETEQWFKARHGLEVCSTDRNVSFCAHTLERSDCLVVLDATADPRFCSNPLVLETPKIRFYAGAPLIDKSGAHLGALCIIDTQSRSEFGDGCRRLLQSLADLVVTQIEKHLVARSAKAAGHFADATGLAILTTDSIGIITYWNPAAELMFGYAAQEITGKSIQLLMPRRFQAQHFSGMLRASTSDNQPFAGTAVEIVAQRRSGQEFPIEITIAKWSGLTGCEFGAHIQDISARVARERKLHHLAHHDVLTGLPNYASFRGSIEACLLEKVIVSLMTIALDGFNNINEAFGYSIGDALLQMVALRLRSSIQVDGILARTAGDRFSILLNSSMSVTSNEAIAQHVLDTLNEPFEVEGHVLHVEFFAGMATGSTDIDADELAAQADRAVLVAKASGSGQIRTYERSMADEISARRTLKDELRLAVTRGELQLFYQPQVRLDNGDTVGTEALLRWNHPTRGLLLPAAFIATLETHLVSYEVGCWVIDEACRQLAAWRAEGWLMPRVAVNLFASQVRAGTLGEVVGAALERHALNPGDLELEITEAIALQQDDDTINIFEDLRAAGVGISFDDFGTGFASLSNLKQFPITRLKIDRSFVRDICDDRHSTAIVSAMVSIGEDLGLEVVIEGVETDQQRETLMKLGCKLGQGYFFGKPCSGDTSFKFVI